MKNYLKISVHVADKCSIANLLEEEMYQQLAYWEEYNFKDAKVYADHLREIIEQLRRE